MSPCAAAWVSSQVACANESELVSFWACACIVFSIKVKLMSGPAQSLADLVGQVPSSLRVAQAGQEAAALRQPAGMACGMCMAVQLLPGQPDGPWVLAGYEDGTLALWDLAAPERPAALVRPHSESVMALAVDASGQGEARCNPLLFRGSPSTLGQPICMLQAV